MSITSMLRRLGWLRQFDVRAIADAEIENVLRDHGIAVTRAESSSEDIKETEGRLLESIRTSRESTLRTADTMAQFVHDMRSFGHHHQRT
jgi:hypothetical protein